MVAKGTRTRSFEALLSCREPEPLMALIFFERVGHEGRRPSPFSWRIRYALEYKGVDFEVRPVQFADVETIRALTGLQLRTADWVRGAGNPIGRRSSPFDLQSPQSQCCQADVAGFSEAIGLDPVGAPAVGRPPHKMPASRIVSLAGTIVPASAGRFGLPPSSCRASSERRRNG